jgi:hypothetical protein
MVAECCQSDGYILSPAQTRFGKNAQNNSLLERTFPLPFRKGVFKRVRSKFLARSFFYSYTRLVLREQSFKRVP